MKLFGVILFLLHLHCSLGEEAHCSRFFYEEQTLAKIVRMEHRLEILEKAAAVTNTCTHCPDTWVSFQGSCYMFAQDDVNFSDAEILCWRLGAHLVHVQSEIENNFLKDYLKQFKESHYWMGLTDRDQEGMFKWSGTNDKASFTDWKSDEPNNNGETEHCVHFHYGGSYSWNDNNCATLMKAVCEQKAK